MLLSNEPRSVGMVPLSLILVYVHIKRSLSQMLVKPPCHFTRGCHRQTWRRIVARQDVIDSSLAKTTATHSPCLGRQTDMRDVLCDCYWSWGSLTCLLHRWRNTTADHHSQTGRGQRHIGQPVLHHTPSMRPQTDIVVGFIE
jgi:hypothetical protein